jgi:hypothetical protein
MNRASLARACSGTASIQEGREVHAYVCALEERLDTALQLLRECRDVMDCEGFDDAVKRIDELLTSSADSPR